MAEQSTRANRAAGLIAGAGHSGSTLLGLTLGSHPEVFYCGEAGKTRLFDDENAPRRKRVCKLCGERCPVWGRFQCDAPVDLYEQVARLSGRPVVVDSTDPSWVGERLGELSDAGVPATLIFLRRDGRAVLGSRLRKSPDADPGELIRRWMEQMERTRDLYAAHPGPKTVVHYERFVREPAATVAELCRLLELSYRDEMLRYERYLHHPLGGNNGTQYLVARAQGFEPEVGGLSGRRRGYYEDHPGGFRLDARWREDLSVEVLQLFERMAGELNEEMAS